jgi:hypothetical protein
METMHAAGRRNLPPVPRPSAERTGSTPEPAGPVLVAERPAPRTSSGIADADLAETGRFEPYVDDAETGRFEPIPAASPDTAADEPSDDGDRLRPPEGGSVTVVDPPAVAEDDLAQRFVARLRSAAVDFAEAAGAESAVVREAVPPARHRRSRCRVVLRYADGAETDLTFLGPVERPGRAALRAFDAEITRWLASGQRREAAWLVRDPDAADGIAVDVTAWSAAA